MGVCIHCASDNEAFDCTVCIARWWADTLNYRLHKLYWPNARTHTHTQTHIHFLKNWRQKQRQGQWGVRLKIQPWFAQHWWAKATLVMSRGGRGLTKSAAIKMMWWDRAKISWKHTADSGVLFDRSSIVIKSKDKREALRLLKDNGCESKVEILICFFKQKCPFLTYSQLSNTTALQLQDRLFSVYYYLL